MLKGRRSARENPKDDDGDDGDDDDDDDEFWFCILRTFLQSDWFQSWLGRVMIYMVVLVVARTLRSVGERGRDGEMRRGFGALKTTKSGGVECTKTTGNRRAMRFDATLRASAVEKNHAGGVSRDGGERVRTNRK